MKTILQALAEQYERYPLRTCRTLHSCSVCEEDIKAGERYYDGGYGRRAHEDCVHPEVIG